MADSKKYFWLRLKRDFFKRHDIQIIEAMENGKDYILFYLKLLCESVDHEGNLRFSEQIPYNDKMLATITNTNVDIVRSAINIFCELGMMDILDDGTYFMGEVQKMIGYETKWAEKKRRQRQKGDNVPQLSSTCPHDVRQEIEKELDIEIEKEIEIEKKRETPAPKEQKHTHGEYNHVKLKDSEVEKLIKDYGVNMTEDCIRFLDEYIEMKGYKAKNHYLCIKKWVVDAVKERQRKNGQSTNKVADQLEQSYEMMAQWAEEG